MNISADRMAAAYFDAIEVSGRGDAERVVCSSGAPNARR